eukprot:jgi/Bigna1/85364/estExt_fgenesh1_pg.C_30359
MGPHELLEFEMRRKTKKTTTSAGGGDSRKSKPAADKGKKGGSEWETYAAWSLFLIPCVVLPSLACGFAYKTYGINFFIPESFKNLAHTPEKWQTEILPGKTVLMLGGPHRGGTTVLWECLRQHPDISDLGSQEDTGIDLSEGIFMQDVYPNFGIGNEYAETDWRRRHGGLGQYALVAEKDVHLNETHRLVSEKNQARLLNRFGYFWDLSKPVLLEKCKKWWAKCGWRLWRRSLDGNDYFYSPSNAVISRFLQELINIKSPGGESRVKFLFITRHPIANAMSHKAWSVCAKMPIPLLVANWISVMEYMNEDKEYLKFVKGRSDNITVKKGETCTNGWGLDPSKVLRTHVVKKDTNTKYRKKYCKSYVAGRKSESTTCRCWSKLGRRSSG